MNFAQGFTQNDGNIEQIITTMAISYLVTLINLRNSAKSNMPFYLPGIVIGFFASKMIYGDWDLGYQWTISDIFFLLAICFVGFIGAMIAKIVL